MLKTKAPLIVGTLLILGLVAFISLYRSSPGELSQAHATVAGSSLITDCKKCHAAAGLPSGCLQCHTEIQNQIQDHRGFHEYLAKNKKTDCGPCHSEHNGPAFALVNATSWEGKDVKTFTHPHVTFELRGAHTTLACERCHQAKFHREITLPKFPKLPRTKTYLGLSQTCVSCHADPHAGGKITTCTQCHDQTHWKPAPLFNHDKFYPLRGAHAATACGKCHAPMTNASRTMPPHVFGPTKGKACADCHASPHHVRWVERCDACHQGTDLHWNEADRRLTKAQHAETGFRWMAPHEKVTCQKCHGPTTSGTSYAVRYPNPKNPGYNRTASACEGCHQDEHRGQFMKTYPKCSLCHPVSGWKPTSFTAARHDKTPYPLVGGHRVAECANCHTQVSGQRTRRYTGTPTACASCHRDIHFGQFREEKGITRCERCHESPVRWSARAFNHETMAHFKLGEAHKKVACKSCHPEVSLKNGVRLIQYKPIKSQCSDCHGFDELQNR